MTALLPIPPGPRAWVAVEVIDPAALPEAASARVKVQSTGAGGTNS
jgi:hypothetical protein